MKSKVPDVTAYCLEEAMHILAAKGLKYRIKKVSSLFFPRRREKKAAEGIQNKVTGYRVLKQTLLTGNTLELIVAREVTGM